MNDIYQATNGRSGDRRLGKGVESMGKIIRFEFLGSGAYFWLLCITIIGIPTAILYLITRTVRVEEEVEDPAELLEEFRSRKIGRKPMV